MFYTMSLIYIFLGLVVAQTYTHKRLQIGCPNPETDSSTNTTADTIRCTFNKGTFIKIKNGAVEVYGVTGRAIKGVEDAVNAIKTIIAASEALKDMPEVVATASGSSIQDSESIVENIHNIIKREFSGVCDICKIVRFKKDLKSNIEKVKTAPKMVKDFCQEVKSIVIDMNNALDEDRSHADNEDTDNEEEVDDLHEKKNGSVQTKQNAKKTRKTEGGKESEDENEGKSTENEEKKKKEKDSKKSKKDKEKKKDDYQKQLKMETVGLADIDKLFTDLMTSLNKFIATREKMQQARESFEKTMKTVCNFDGEKEFKTYIKELKEKAKQGKIQIYIDTNNGEIKLDSVKGVDPPAPYRNAVKALNDIKASAKETVDLEPVVERGLESCGRDITKIEPLKDFKKLVSGVKETMTLPKKAKAFNENRKKVQQAPQIVKEFCLYVKQILADIVNAFNEDDNTKEKDEETAVKDDSNEDDANGGNDEDDKKEQIVEAVVHAPGSSTKMEDGLLEENSGTVAC